MKLNWLNLEFETSSDNLENRFREKYFSSNIRHVRNCHLYTIAFYAAAGYIDYLFFKEDLFWLFLIRFLIVIPIFIAGFLFSFSSYYEKLWQLISLFYVLLTGCSFIAFMAIGDPPKAYDYYVGIFFCMVFGYTFIRLRFIYAAISGMILLTAYLLVSKAIIDLPDYDLFLSTFYLLLINFLGMMISRHSEISARKDFHLEYVLSKAREEVVDLNSTLDERIKERTQSLIEVNKDLRNEISDRKRIERKLRETQNTFKVLFNEAPDPIFIINMEDKILDANIAACQMLGYTPNEYKRMSVLDLQAPEVRTTQSGIIKKELLKGELFEGMDIHKDGTRIPVEINNRRTIIDGQELVLSIVRDITKRKEIEETFKKHEQRIQSIFRAAPTGIGLVVERELVEVNERMLEMTGYSKLELIGKNARILYSTDEDYEYVGTEKYRQIKETGTGTVETRFRRKSGELIDVLMSSTPLDQSDWSKGVSFTALDITERKRAEKELQISHQRFLKVLDSIDATIYVADMETYEILFMNRHMINDFGKDFTGKLCWKVFRGEKAPCPECSNEKLIDPEGNPLDVFIWQNKNPVNQKTYVNYDRAIQWTDGRLVRLQIATDITEFKKMEEQLRQAQKIESVGRLAGGIAHDFNNMLSIILGNIELAMDAIDPSDPLNKNLNEIQTAANRSANLTRQLLAFARKQTISPMVLNLNRTIEGMLKMLLRLIGEDIGVTWHPQKELWPVKVDPSQVDQVLANLCVNARDAIKDVGKITIETYNTTLDEDYCKDNTGFRPGEYVVIGVSDNGCGIEKETLKNVFDPFFTTKGVGQGTGLGLATVYGIAKQNKGFINVYSEVDEGTTFKIYLPRHYENTEDLQQQNPQLKMKKGNETILLVEDEKDILRVTKKIIEHMGYNVLASDKPEDAINISKNYEKKIDLLMTDVVMPLMNGRDLADELVLTRPDMKTLFMSGYTANVVAHRGILDKGLNFISKPFSRQELSMKLRGILDDRSD